MRADGSLLYVTQFLLEAAVTTIDVASFSVAGVTPIPDQPLDPSLNTLIPNGEVRTVYAAVPRPDDGEIWVLHQLLANQTPEPVLVFNNTAFPTITRLAPGGWNVDDRLMLAPSTPLTFGGAFIDVVSGFRDIAFTPDGALALVADAQSEDVMVFDAANGDEIALVRPTPSALIEGIVVDSTGTHAYLQGRGTHNVTVLSIDENGESSKVAVAGPPIECLPPATRCPRTFAAASGSSTAATRPSFPSRRTSGSPARPATPKGRATPSPGSSSRARATPPPTREDQSTPASCSARPFGTPSFSTTRRSRSSRAAATAEFDPSQLPDLQALADFVNYAIPFPQNPNLSQSGVLTPSQASGQQIFNSPQAKCFSCHTGPYFTDSGAGNPSLDFGVPPLLHDIGTCVTTAPFPTSPTRIPTGKGGEHARSILRACGASSRPRLTCTTAARRPWTSPSPGLCPG